MSQSNLESVVNIGLDSIAGPMIMQRNNLSPSTSKFSIKTLNKLQEKISETENQALAANSRIIPNDLTNEESYQLEIGFTNLTYSVKSGFFKRQSKTILNGLTGTFRAGELSAIVGASGAGKSTLLHLISSYRNTGYSGLITVNGEPRDFKTFKPNVAYIAQDNSLHPYLTVKEAMHFAANLKLGYDMTRSEKKERVSKILESIGIYEHRHTRTCDLSGGQKKRLAIALEIVNNPPVLILDEPTSGLDSSTANQCVMLLKNLAMEGRTVICTIHQPSASAFKMFDFLYAIAESKCIYAGSTRKLVPFLREVDLHCPESYNPADYLLEISTDDYGKQNHKLTASIENGRNNNYREYKSIKPEIKPAKPKFIPLSSKSNMSSKTSILLNDVHDGSTKCSRKASEIDTTKPHSKAPQSLCRRSNVYATPLYKQISILLLRTFLILGRDHSLTSLRFSIHLSVALMIGFLYYNIGNDASNALNNFRYTFYSLMFVMFCAFSSVIIKFPLEFPIVSREHFNRWYSLRAYYIAMTLADIPIQVICTCLYVVTTYLLTGQPMEWLRFSLFIFIIFLTALVAQSIGLTVGASLSIANGVIIGPFFITPFFVFSGFFLQHKDAPSSMGWLFYFSFLKYSLDGAMLALFGFNREKLECNEIYCHYVSPKFFLKNIDLMSARYEEAVIFLLAVLIAMKTIAFYIMSFRLRLFR